MPDLMTALRMRSLFDPTKQVGAGIGAGTDMSTGIAPGQNMNADFGQESFDPNKMPIFTHPDDMKGMVYHPSTEMSDKFRNYLDQMPNRADFKPSGFQKFRGVLAGLGTGGPETYAGATPIGLRFGNAEKAQQDMLDKPFNQAMGDWSNGISVRERAMANEQAQNTNQRILFNDLEGRRIQDKNADTKIADLERKSKEGETKAQTANERADSYIARNKALIDKYDSDMKIQQGKLQLARDIADKKVAGLKQDKEGKWNVVKADGTTIPTDVTGFTPEELEHFKVNAAADKAKNAKPKTSIVYDKDGNSFEYNFDTKDMTPINTPDKKPISNKPPIEPITGVQFDDKGNETGRVVTTHGAPQKIRVMTADGKTGTMSKDEALPKGWKYIDDKGNEVDKDGKPIKVVK